MIKGTFKRLAALVTAIILMFGWIFVTVALTGGRELEEFTRRDNIIFVLFILAEIITFGVMCLVLHKEVKAAKEERKRNNEVYVPLTIADKLRKRRGVLITFLGFLSAFAVLLGGVAAANYLPAGYNNFMKILLIVSCFVFALLCFLNAVLQRKFMEKLKNENVEKMHKYLISHRDSAEKASVEKLAFLKKLIFLTDMYTVFLVLLGCLIAFSAGSLLNTEASVIFCFVSGFLFISAYERIRLPQNEHVLDDDTTCLSMEEYPEIYASARKAAKALGCSGRVKICVADNCNVGIGKVGGVYLVQVGVIALSVFTREELYNVFLHEFSHIANENASCEKVGKYNNLVCSENDGNFFSGLVSLLFGYPDTVYFFNHSIYLYAVSLINETSADRAMAELGSPETAASALLKLKYYEMFQWEKGTYDENCVYENEENDKYYVTNEINAFKAATETRKNFWNSLVEKEILSRNASHPTLKMRLEVLGVKALPEIEYEKRGAYAEECKKALAYVENLVYEENKEIYEEDRKTYYLEPKKAVEEWEEKGKPVIPEEYADISTYLRYLGRSKEAEEVCDRAASELSPAAAHYAYYMKGMYLLHRYNPEGVEYIYRAIENNMSYTEEGLDTIGSFCCMTGMQKELDTYREKAAVLTQKQIDEFDEIGTLSRKDNLSSEKLPEGMLEKILSFILSNDEGEIDKIYLVRKTVNENFFASVFVIRFSDSADDEKCYNIFHKIFSYLDTFDERQFALFEYWDVKNVKVEKIEGSCVYSKSEQVK